MANSLHTLWCMGTGCDSSPIPALILSGASIHPLEPAPYIIMVQQSTPTARTSVPMESFSGPFISIFYLAVLTALFLSIRHYSRVRRLRWPPGPRGLPVLGNLFDIPTSQRWLRFQSLCAIYGETRVLEHHSASHVTTDSLSPFVGDVLHLRAFNSSIVVLGSADVIQECLEKRSAITSDRSHSHMFKLYVLSISSIVLCRLDLKIALRTGNDFNLAFMPYGDWWRRHRRAFWQYFRPQAIAEYRAIQRAMASIFLKKMLQTPNHLTEHLQYVCVVSWQFPRSQVNSPSPTARSQRHFSRFYTI